MALTVWLLTVKQSVAQAGKGYNAISDQIISTRLLGKPIKITVIQVQMLKKKSKALIQVSRRKLITLQNRLC